LKGPGDAASPGAAQRQRRPAEARLVVAPRRVRFQLELPERGPGLRPAERHVRIDRVLPRLSYGIARDDLRVRRDLDRALLLGGGDGRKAGDE
jgi:hypothetical protein